MSAGRILGVALCGSNSNRTVEDAVVDCPECLRLLAKQPTDIALAYARDRLRP